MKKRTMRLFAACVAFGLLFSAASAQTADDSDYTLEEKLSKQIQAGSGFEGTLTVGSAAVEGRESEAFTTIQPLTFDFEYIYVRADAATGTDAESRLILSFMNGEDTLGTAECSFRTGLAALKSTLLGDGWYTLSDAAGDLAGDGDAQGALAQSARGALGETALPGMAAFAAGVLSRLSGADTTQWADATEPYATKIDLWIEGYRQNALLSKDANGETTMEIDYDIPVSAVKAQLKQLVMDLLADDALVALLSASLPEEDVANYLDPAQQEYYFYAIDELPLTGDLLISRTLSLQGDTLALSLTLPLYDAQSGQATLTYDRSRGSGDLPEENTIRLETSDTLVQLTYQTYETLTGTTVYQGTLLRSPPDADTFEVGAEAAPAADVEKTFSATFALTASRTEGTDELGQDTVNVAYQLTLSPEYGEGSDGEQADAATTETQTANYVTFSPFTLALTGEYVSGQAKNASTSVDITLALSGEDMPQIVTLTFSGKTKSKWTPDPIDLKAATAIDGMDQAALSALLAQAAVKGGLMFLPYVGLPSASDGTQATAAPTVAPTETTVPTAIPTLASTATPEAAD